MASHTHTHTHTQVASLCNLSGLSKNKEGVWERVGESTESALKVLCEKIGAGPEAPATGGGEGAAAAQSDTPVNDAWAKRYPRLATLEFDRARKSMSVLVGDGSDLTGGILLVKGAAEMVPLPPPSPSSSPPTEL